MPVEASFVKNQMQSLGFVDTFGTRKEVRELPNILAVGETIFGMASGMMDGSTWLITVTDKRIIMLDKGLVFGLKQLELPISQVKSVTYKMGMLLGELLVDTGGQTKKFENMQKSEAQKIAAVISRLLHQGAAGGAAQPATGKSVQNDMLEQLERLAALKEKGLLSDEEFAAGKRRLLEG